MFERFTEKAIKVIMLAQEEARRLGHNFVGTEQILLGLIGEGTGIGPKVLKSMGVNLKDARVEVEKIIGRGSGFVAVEIPFILSNHNDLRYIAEQFSIPFYHVPFTKANRVTAEQEQIAILEKHDVDFIVLARYMQIVSGNLIDKYPNKIINIHHSFLPAFAGAKPYHAAFKRGVKIIGATSHYVTEELDAGPIIEQDVTTVTHSHTIEDFITKGRDLEKIVLSRGVKLHIARKTMVYNNKTVIFS